MAINLNPASIANAGIYPGLATATAMPLNTCRPPDERQLKGVSLQIKYASAPGQLINLQQGSTPPLTQISCLWVDNRNSEHDVTIIFPDSGFAPTVAFGAQKIVPVLSGVKIPQFYVMLNDNGKTSATDSTNIIVLNQYLPEFNSEDFSNVQIFGIGNNFELVAQFTQSIVAPVEIDFPANASTIINAKQWYITAIYMNIAFNAAANNYGFVTLFDNGVPFIKSQFSGNAGIFVTANLMEMGGMNLKSSGNGPLTATVTWNAGGGVGDSYGVTIAIFGGVLIP